MRPSMDDRQFDGLAKALRSGADRRRVLGLFAGGLVAALRSPRATVASHELHHCTKEGHPAKTKKGCCAGLLSCTVFDCSGDICAQRLTCASMSRATRSTAAAA